MTAGQVEAGVDGLAAIIGTWKGTGATGAMVLSTCAWTPQHVAVVCDQTISPADGERHVTNVYAFNAVDKRYVFYSLGKPGEPIQAVPLTIAGHVWTYGGARPPDGGLIYRTINDFEKASSYTWKIQSSRDGAAWTTIVEGTSTRASP